MTSCYILPCWKVGLLMLWENNLGNTDRQYLYRSIKLTHKIAIVSMVHFSLRAKTNYHWLKMLSSAMLCNDQKGSWKCGANMTYTTYIRIYDRFLTLVGHVLCWCCKFSKLKCLSVVSEQIMFSLFLPCCQFKIYNTDVPFLKIKLLGIFESTSSG
jgi:hypothetical protein